MILKKEIIGYSLKVKRVAHLSMADVLTNVERSMLIYTKSAHPTCMCVIIGKSTQKK